MFGLRSILVATMCAASLSACMKSPTLAFENATGSELIFRASVDSWFNASECNSGKALGAINRQGNFTIQPGQRLCMKAKARKDGKPAGELISQIIVMRDGQRCFTANRDQILSSVTRSGGFSAVVMTEDVCPAVVAPAAPAE